MRKSIIRTSPYFLAVRRGVSGLGVFTNNYIKRNTFVVEYEGELITNKEADRRGGKYLFKINKDWVIDGTSRKNIARYINHSCRPNCEDRIKGKRIFIYSKRNIKPGTELTFYYGKEYFNEYIKPKGCGCEKCLENEASTGSRPWYLSFLRRNPPKHPPSLFELRRVHRSHSSMGLRPWSSAKADKNIIRRRVIPSARPPKKKRKKQY